MKAILSFVVAGLFVSCSSDDNPASRSDSKGSIEEIIVGTWDVSQNGGYFFTMVFQADGTVEESYKDGTPDMSETYSWNIKKQVDIINWTASTETASNDILILSPITSPLEYYKIEMINDDVLVTTYLNEDGTVSRENPYTYRRVSNP
tara:strand:+ start:334 stop:777 length:444 start_codon:yes stop_codon:yes gene_type:complete